MADLPPDPSVPPDWVHADFNGLFGPVLCLAHEDTSVRADGTTLVLSAGLVLTAFEPDVEDGRPDPLVATGVVEPAPEWLSCAGSRWVLRLDARGVQHRSDREASAG